MEQRIILTTILFIYLLTTTTNADLSSGDASVVTPTDGTDATGGGSSPQSESSANATEPATSIRNTNSAEINVNSSNDGSSAVTSINGTDATGGGSSPQSELSANATEPATSIRNTDSDVVNGNSSNDGSSVVTSTNVTDATSDGSSPHSGIPGNATRPSKVNSTAATGEPVSTNENGSTKTNATKRGSGRSSSAFLRPCVLLISNMLILLL
ncbi:hypothetical protein Aperf_G00000131677 [Anoplocephala perfoliata]